MNVADLIRALEAMPGHLPVKVYDHHESSTKDELAVELAADAVYLEVGHP